MKFNYKKIASVLASAVMLSSTVGFASALSYPSPFVSSGMADGAVVVGSVADASDWAAAVGMATELSGLVSEDETSSSVSGGAAKSLSEGSDLMYLNDELSENVATLSDSDLPTLLADGTFTDDEGTDYEYEQTISIGTSANNGFAFSNSDGDLDDPTLLVQISENEDSTPIYTLVVNFEDTVPFNATDSEGETIELFGKEYTIGTQTDGDSLVLLGGASETTINVGESITADLGDDSVEVSLIAISTSDDSPQASISINGQTNTFTEGQTKKVDGVDVFAKTVFKTGDNQGYVIIQLGSNRLTFEDGSEVQIGSDNDQIDGTSVDLVGTVNALDELRINISAEDSDNNHVLEGDSMVDPVFGTVSLDFVDVKNGPMLETHSDDSETRKMLKITAEGDRELGLMADVKGNNDVDLPLSYQGTLADDDNDPIHVVEGEPLAQDDYFILNSGDYQYFMELTRLSLGTGSNANSDVHFRDLITGESYTDKVNDDDDLSTNASTSTTFQINSQTFTVQGYNDTAVRIFSSDYNLTSGSGTVDIYPVIETIDGKDHLFALVEDVTLTTVKNGTTLNFPTGTVTVGGNNASTFSSNSSGHSVTYQITATAGLSNSTLVIGVSDTLTGGNQDSNASVLFVEEEDDTDSDTKNAVLLRTDDDASFMDALTPVFSSTSDSETFDDTDFIGYLDNFGAYAVKDSSDDDQTLTSLTYSSEQMYAEIFISETGTTITPGSSGAGGQILTVRDSDVSSVSGKNLLVVGGSCVNTVAAEILGSTSPLCGADFTEATGVNSGQYILKTVESPWDADQVAMLVAGYNPADTVNAVGKVREGASTDVGEAIYPQLA